MTAKRLLVNLQTREKCAKSCKAKKVSEKKFNMQLPNEIDELLWKDIPIVDALSYIESASFLPPTESFLGQKQDYRKLL